MELPSNSQTSRPMPSPPVEKTEKVVSKVVTGTVERKKQPLGRRVLGTFFSGDAKSVVGYVAIEVLLPALKDMVFDAGSEALRRLIHGDNYYSATNRRFRTVGANRFEQRTNYNQMSQAGPPSSSMRREEARGISRQGRARHQFDELLFESRIEADEVIAGMYDLLERYGTVSVSDMLNLAGVTPEYTDEKWGWTKLDGARVERDHRSSKYLINLPSTEQLA